MKAFSIFAAIGLAAATPASALAQEDVSATTAPNEAQLVLAREVIDNGFPPETRIDAMLGVADQMIGQIMAANPNIDSDPRVRRVMDDFAESVIDTTRSVLEGHMDGLMEGMAIAYAESFSEPELLALRDFVSTEEGYGFLTRITHINSHPAYAEANQRYVNDYMTHMPALMAELQASLADAASKDAATGK